MLIVARDRVAGVCDVSAQGAPAKLTVSSTAFKNGEAIPADYTADGRNVSPPLAWSGAPSGTREFALILDDPDAPTPQPFVHWVIYKIPGNATGLPEAVPMGGTVKAHRRRPAPAGPDRLRHVRARRRTSARPGLPRTGAAFRQAASLHLQGLRAERDR